MATQQLTFEQILATLPEVQKRKAKAARARAVQQSFEQMGQRPGSGNSTPTQMGGLYETVSQWRPDYGQMGNQVLGGMGTDVFGRRAAKEEEELANQTNEQIIRTTEQIGQNRAGTAEPGGPTETALRGYLGLLGGEAGADLLGKQAHVSSTKIADDGEILNIMSDNTVIPTGRYADYKSQVLQIPGQEVATVGTSGAGRGRVSDLQYPGTPPFVPPGEAPYAPPQAAPPPAPPYANPPVAPGGFGPMTKPPGRNAPLEERVRWTESRGKDNAVSEAGAVGPMQLMPPTARELEKALDMPPGMTDTNAAANYKAGSQYINERLEARNGDERLALMDYNWGMGNVNKWLASGADPSKIPQETRDYVDRVASGGEQYVPDPARAPAVGMAAPPAGPGRSPLVVPSAYDKAADKANAEADVARQRSGEAAAIAAEEKGAVLDAETLATMRADLPKSEETLLTVNSSVDQLINHPGLDMIVGGMLGRVPDGTTSEMYVNAVMAGTPAVAALALHNQIKGTVFSRAYETLKGGGQITEFEGKQARDAMARINRAQSKDEYIKALQEFQSAVRRGVDKMRRAVAEGRLNPDLLPPAGGAVAAPSGLPQGVTLPPGFTLED